MSESENSSNNQIPPPDSVILTTLPTDLAPSDYQFAAQTHPKDSRFYYYDGSAVFLVENKLFKFQASLLAADAEDYEFKHIVKDAIDGCKGDTNKLGTDHAHPIVLPADVTASQFRDFLMVVFGGVTNSNFLVFLNTLRTRSSYNPLLVSRLVNIGYLGCRFGMKRLDNWSQVQIYTILHEFVVTNRLTDDWDARVFLRLVQYVQNATNSAYRAKLSVLMRHIMSASVKKAYELNDEIPQGNIIDICATLYQAKDILISSPGIFGFIFAVIVSLGHQSSIWNERLTREDRRILYAASSILTRLSNHADLEVGWVTDPTEIKVVCSQCSSNFGAFWKDAFSQCEGLKSRVPSEDIRHVVCLPAYRIHFWSISSATCQCPNKTAINIDQKMELLYCGLTEKYKSLVEYVLQH
ncbi:unnamed protein product [Rhizoctonia solani]|uniref:BTB domain-containing protein n=1 Tax=Rhizoctonia solani TaxID=456999 RepID=A0A8H3ATI8_9AGAM|nr:unnamed protein product [Rhizoctonia solani]